MNAINYIPEKMYDIKDATHSLLCKKNMRGKKQLKYYIPCILLKGMDYDKDLVKVVAFNNPKLDRIYKIRYVKRSNLKVKKNGFI
jgi:hypothetical protein